MYGFFSAESTQQAIRQLAEADKLSVFVGAGSSKEVGLPTWAELIDRLVLTATASLLPEAQETVRDYVVDSGLLTAAERVERMLQDRAMVGEIKRALYRDTPPGALVPGPLTLAVANLKIADDDVTVLTTNYDQLLVRAIRDCDGEAASYCTNSTRPGAILHLHGVVGFEPPEDGQNQVILTEHDYLAAHSGGWRQDAVRGALDHGASLFVGASLTDLNLLQPLHQSAATQSGSRHVVVFVRDARNEADAQAEIERIEKLRWEALGVTAVFADNYSDVGQFVDEIRRRRSQAESYESLGRRFQTWCQGIVVPLTQSTDSPNPVSYASSQKELAEALEQLLERVQTTFDLDDEVMQIGLFAQGCTDDPCDDFALIVATSDRVMLDPRSNERLPLTQKTSWTGVQAMTSGIPVWEQKDHYASRWKHMLAVPLWADEPLGCCVGSVVLSSTSQDSKLAVIGGGSSEVPDYAGLYDMLREAGKLILGSQSV